MAKTLAKLIFAGAAASLVFAPVAAQAGTRAGDNGQVYTSANSGSNSQPGMRRAIEGEDFAGGLNAIHLLIFVYVAAWTTGFIIEATDDDDDDFAQSPGV